MISRKVRVRMTRRGERLDGIASALSGEWMLETSPYTANGGTVIVFRALWIATLVWLPAFVLKATLSEGRTADLDIRQGVADLVAILPWFGAVFGASYVALYTRFSSQWSYLAGLYNQIMQSELALPDNTEDRLATLDAWKAAFLEDAEELHLAMKPLFLPAVIQWGEDVNVASSYSTNAVGGATRLERLVRTAKAVSAKANAEYSAKHGTS